MTIELPAEEYEVLENEKGRITVKDKVTDKVCTWRKDTKSWLFPRGSRFETISRLTGLPLGDL